MLRFHLPLVKPDVRISRIRLTYKESCVRPRDVAITQAKLNQTELVMQVFIGVTCNPPTLQLVFIRKRLVDSDVLIKCKRTVALKTD